MGNLDLYNKYRKVPTEAKKTIQAGKLKGFTDINPMWRIKMLTEEFGICGIGWYTEILNRWIEKGPDGKEAAFVEIALYIKVNGEWSKPIIGVGGIMSPEDAYEMIKAGASLVEIYSGFIYEGPALIKRIIKYLESHTISKA